MSRFLYRQFLVTCIWAVLSALHVDGCISQINLATCDPLPKIENGAVPASYRHWPFIPAGTTLTYTCNAGYRQLESNTLKCDDNGKWHVNGHCKKYYLSIADLKQRMEQSLIDGNVYLVQDFLQRRSSSVDLNYRDDGDVAKCKYSTLKRGTVLHQAVCSNKPLMREIALLLLDYGADIDAKADKGQTPLMFAVMNNNAETVRILLEHGADIDARNDDGDTPFLLALLDAHFGIAQLLLAYGVNTTLGNSKGETPLMFSIWHWRSNLQIFRRLLDLDTAVNATDNQGKSALIYAAQYGCVACVRLLLDRGAFINARDNLGYTPLFYAAKFGRLDLKIGTGLSTKDGSRTINLKIRPASNYDTPLNPNQKQFYTETVRVLFIRGGNL